MGWREDVESKSPPGLSVARCGYSRSPWRIILNGREFWPGSQPFFVFERKRDAVPFLEKLRAIGDWTGGKDREFSEEQVARVWELAKQTDSYKLFMNIMDRPRTPFL